MNGRCRWSFGPDGVCFQNVAYQWSIDWGSLACLLLATDHARGRPITQHEDTGGGWIVTVGDLDASKEPTVIRFAPGALERAIRDHVGPTPLPRTPTELH